MEIWFECFHYLGRDFLARASVLYLRAVDWTREV